MSVNPYTYLYGQAYAESMVLPGDTTPTNFDWNLKLTNTQLMGLYLRNEVLQLACDWQVEEAFRQGIELQSDAPITRLKYGADFNFESFLDFLQWLDFWEELNSAAGWARLFGQALMVFFDDQEAADLGDTAATKGQKYALRANAAGQYLSCHAYHPICTTDEGANGYEIGRVNQATGQAETYLLHLQTKGMEHSHEIEVAADRVVEFNWKKRQIRYGGDSRVRGLALLALCEEQATRRMMKRMHDLAGGILCFPKVHDATEKDALLGELGTDDPTSMDRMFGDDAESFPTWLSPDLKVNTEFTAAFNIFTRKESRFLHIAQKAMDGESQGIRASGQFDFMSGETEIYQIQEMFRTAMERCFHKLGLADTRFTYIQPVPASIAPDGAAGAAGETRAPPTSQQDGSPTEAEVI